ncbi:hypothetical protein VTN77DRAFT_6985 [Rasamsonia byssochlamydoides]|uniref:uncharacterized protein n=1 Tax=Rasamsonia byssochlamydoides TaxID=89139 RepID=UPI003744A033
MATAIPSSVLILSTYSLCVPFKPGVKIPKPPEIRVWKLLAQSAARSRAKPTQAAQAARLGGRIITRWPSGRTTREEWAGRCEPVSKPSLE